MFKKRFKRIKLGIALLTLSVWLLGCGGYVPVPILPEHIQSIAIKNFDNKTIHYEIEENLTITVTDEFLRDGSLDVVKEQEADALLSGIITQYILEPISYDENDIIEEYKLWVTVDLSFKDLTTDTPDGTGTILWEDKGMEGSVNYFVSSKAGELIETEDEAQDRLVDELAVDIVRRTIEGW